MYGDGLYVRDWMYVLDHCEGIDFVLHNGRTRAKPITSAAATSATT